MSMNSANNLMVKNFANTEVIEASDPLKGLLMDKGERASGKLLALFEERTKLCLGAMRNLTLVHKKLALDYGCPYLRLHVVIEGRSCSGVGRGNKRVDPRVVDAGLKGAATLVWLANHELVKRTGGAITTSKRVSPFSPDQIDYSLVKQVFVEDAPAYYQTLAAFENLRLTLNSSHKIFRTLAIDVMRANYEAGLEDMPWFTASNRRESEKLLRSIDGSGEINRAVNSLFAVSN